MFERVALEGLTELVIAHERYAGGFGLICAFAVQKFQGSADLGQPLMNSGRVRLGEHSLALAEAGNNS